MLRLMRLVYLSMSRKKKTRGKGSTRVIVRPLGGRVL